MVSLQERQRATETLFGNSDQTNGLFNLDHNLTAYNQLVQDKYSDAEANEMEQFQPEPKYTLESYYMPEQVTTVNKTPVYQAPALENYYNSANPLPVTQTSFRPKIYDSNLREVDINTANNFTKIAEVNIETSHKATAEPDTDTDFIPTFRLSAKGIIAVVGLIAVAVLVFTLIIVNSVGIAGSSARIQQLKASNNELINTTLPEAQSAYLAEVEKAALLANDTVYGQGYNPDGTLVSGYKPVTPQQLPPTAKIAQPANGTNFFDQLSRFFSKLFGGN